MACTTCNGTGTLPADDPRVDAQLTDELGICPDCWHKGICPDCGKLGWDAPNDNNLSSAPCSHCGWNHKVTGEFKGEFPKELRLLQYVPKVGFEFVTSAKGIAGIIGYLWEHSEIYDESERLKIVDERDEVVAEYDPDEEVWSGETLSPDDAERLDWSLR